MDSILGSFWEERHKSVKYLYSISEANLNHARKVRRGRAKVCGIRQVGGCPEGEKRRVPWWWDRFVAQDTVGPRKVEVEFAAATSDSVVISLVG